MIMKVVADYNESHPACEGAAEFSPERRKPSLQLPVNLLRTPSVFDGLRWLRKCALPFMGKHIPIDRAWILIQDATGLSAAEAEHLDGCGDCRQFLESFVSVARYLGFPVDFPRRDHDVDRERAA